MRLWKAFPERVTALSFVSLMALASFSAKSDPPTEPYEQDVIFSDGPILYGTGLGDEDRASAWKHLFMQMVTACGQQQGKDVLSLKLAKRCQPDKSSCSIAIDAKFSGIGGIKEPRKVLLIVDTDPDKPEIQFSRTVCTYPSDDVRVCREWDTGKLISVSQK